MSTPSSPIAGARKTETLGPPLPSLESVLPAVGSLLNSFGYLGLILVDLEPLSYIEAECGSTIYNQLISRICAVMTTLPRRGLRVGDLTCCVRHYGEQIVIFLDGSRQRTLNVRAVELVADRLWKSLAPEVLEMVRPFGVRGRLRLGYSLVMMNPMIQTERLIFRGVDQARSMALEYSHRVDTRSRERLRDLIVNRKLTTFFQPILQLEQQGVCAYEALIRGPLQTELSSPAMLFHLATHAGLVAELDRACCETTLSSVGNMPEEALLFTNVLPNLINDPGFRNWIVEKARGLGEQRLVLELNEGVAIRNYDLLSEGIAQLRQAGIRLAVDDLGSGYANLDHILRLKPDFLKLDLSLIREVHQSKVKQALISSMVTVGQAVDATVIAEGIEEKAEYDTLLALGVEWGQGYWFARPGPGFVKVNGSPPA